MGETVRLRAVGEVPAYRPGLVTALDVGSSKIACLIGRAEHGSLRILGAALRESQGIKGGTIVSLDLAEESIRDCVAAAENHADARIQNVLISLTCGQPVSVTSRAVMSLDGALVTDAHLRALLADGRAKCKLDNHEIIQSAPTAYVVSVTGALVSTFTTVERSVSGSVGPGTYSVSVTAENDCGISPPAAPVTIVVP